MNRLEKWRGDIGQIDEQLIELIARRLELAEKIGLEKRRTKSPIRDWSIEKDVLERARRCAERLQVPADLVTAIMAKLIGESCARQEGLPLVGQERSSDQVLVIGGKGRMGSWFARFFRNQGRQVAVIDPAGPLPGFPSFQDLSQACRWATLILLATPLASSPGVYQELIDLAPDGVICDIASIKSGLIDRIREARSAGLRVASLHPLFGPDTRILSDKIICLCDCDNRSSLEKLRQLLGETSAQLVELPLEHHDRLMTYILGLSHVINIIFAQTLASSGLNYGELSQVASTTFLRQMDTTRSVVTENPKLYFEIQRANPFSEELFDRLRAALESITGLIISEDLQRFQEVMGRSRDYLTAIDPGGQEKGEKEKRS
jgi:chorismate mutase/prephenate dehydrogenase